MRTLQRAGQATRFLPVLGLVLLALVMRTVDFGKAWQVVLAADGRLLMLSLYLVFVEAAVKSFKLQVLTATHCHCSFVTAVRVYLSGILFGAISPGKIGDFVKVYSLSKQTGLETLPSFAIVLVERILDLACLMVLTIAGLWTLLARGNADAGAAEAGLISIAFIAAFGLLLSARAARLLWMPVHRLVVSRAGTDRYLSRFDSFYDAVSATYRPARTAIPAILLGLAGWAVVSLRSYILATALGVNVDFTSFFLLWPIVIAVEILPVSILGLGTREYAIAHLLSGFGVSVESAVVLSLLGFVLVIVPLTLGGCVSVFLESVGRAKPRQDVVGGQVSALTRGEDR